MGPEFGGHACPRTVRPVSVSEIFQKIYFRVRVRGFKNFHVRVRVRVRGFKNCHVRVRVRVRDFKNRHVRVRVSPRRKLYSCLLV